jgi:hypothetical protein
MDSTSSTFERLPVDLVHRQPAGRKPHGTRHKTAAIHVELLGFFGGHFADQVLHLLLARRLAARQ